MNQPWLRPIRTLPVAAGLVTAGYALIAWLTVIPNQDLLADGIQVQRLIQNPELVLSFPGQKHGGVLEYLFNIPSELISPGNYFLESSIRVLLAFLTGFMAAKLYRTLFPDGASWSFILAVIAGPTILQGLAGPASNPVGVYWLTPNYDLAWLLVTLGLWVVAKGLIRYSAGLSGILHWLFGGLTIGLGLYQQPTVMMLLIPLVVLLLLRIRVTIKALVITACGILIGLIPALVSYATQQNNTWDPSHFPTFLPRIALASLGLDGIPSYFTAILPFAFGLAPSEDQRLSQIQSIITGLVLVSIFFGATWGTYRSLRLRQRPSPGTAIALAWLSACIAIVIFGTLVDPIWFYGAGLAVLLWMSVGILPDAFRPRWFALSLSALAIVVVGTSTLSHNFYWYKNFGSRVSDKITYLDTQRFQADVISEFGVEFVYGSYYDALPVSYGSGGVLHPVTSTYNRFPVEYEEFGGTDEVRVAVNTKPRDPWGRESLARVTRDCTLHQTINWPTDRYTSSTLNFDIYRCPTTLILNPANS